MKKGIVQNSRLWVGLLLLVAVLLGACTTAQPTTPPPPTDTPEPLVEAPEPTPLPVDYSSVPIVGMTWYWLESQYNDDTSLVSPDPSVYSVQFNADGTYNGQADCNMISGVYTVEGASISLQPGITTLVACPPESKADRYLQDLFGVTTYLLEEGFLYLDIQMDTGTMKFSDQPVPVESAPVYADQPFVGKVWQWLRLDMSDGTTTTVPNPPAYTIEFLPDGTVTGQADCNSMGGTYTASDASLQIVVSQLTRVACPPESLADQYVQRLTEVATYVIENGVLYLNLMADAGNMVFGEQPVAVLPAPVPGAPSAQATANVNVRSGPGTDYPVYGVMPAGRVAEVVGKNAEGTWWTLSAPVVPLGQAWVSGDYVTTTAAESVPVIPAPPVPPTAEFSPPAPDDPQITALDADYVRSGPGEQFPAYGVAQPGAKGLLIGRSQDGKFWVVRINPQLVSTGFGWISTAFTVASNVPDDLPVIEAPPSPPVVEVPTPPAGTPTGVALTAVNVRSGPGTTYSILGVAPTGSVGEITGKSSDGAWWQVRVPNTLTPDGFAWVSAAYVNAVNTANVPVVAAPTAVPVITPVPPITLPTNPPSTSGGTVRVGVTIDTVNLRAGPGNQYESYGVLPIGSTGVIIGSNPEGTWLTFQVPTSIAPDGKGWISAAYVKVSVVNYATATAMAKPINPAITKTPAPGATSPPPVTNACKIIEKKPVDGTVFKQNFEFDMKVVLENNSTSDWNPNSVDIKFISSLGNAPIHVSPDLFDLQELVNPGKQTTIYVDMKTPAQNGVYGETWALVQGSSVLCQWSFTVTVQK